MLASDALRFVLVSALAAAVLTGTVQLWMVYVARDRRSALVSGVFMPAAEAALPRLVGTDQLEAGNGLMMGTNQLAQFVGPAAAGTLIALFGQATVAGSSVASLTGIGVAMSVDAPRFAVSALTLLALRASARHRRRPARAPARSRSARASGSPSRVPACAGCSG